MSDAKLWKIFSEFIRLRDTDQEGFGKCFTCNRIIHWKKGDCGHGLGRQHKATKFNECNNHLQCKTCNGFEGGKREVYKEEMDKRYGSDTWNKLEIASRQICKRGKFEIEMMTEYYKKEVQKLKLEKNL